MEARRSVKASKRETAGAGGDNSALKDVAQDARIKARVVMREAVEARIVRAVHGPRQLQEVMTAFWFNHFNVFAGKGLDNIWTGAFEENAIRPHTMGRFRTLLGATAHHPAMLFYLDNWQNTAPGSPGSKGKFEGINENYARELMELHTLGVDGGFTQKDVTEVARAFTGWTMPGPRQGNGFTFNPRLHDPGEKVVLGHVIKAGGGEADGEQVLDILAAHPSTATFIATKLARRFVSDTPPPALVARVAARFRDTRGDLREVTRAILMSPEFLSPDAFNAKVKTPFEFVASAVRATGADVHDALPLVRNLQQLGMPLYQCQPPTGYKDTADAWVNTGALVSRMNFATRLAGNKLPGTTVAGDEPVSELALRLGGPEFQRK
jgi:uncharacterized protein (DUF1800 family)